MAPARKVDSDQKVWIVNEAGHDFSPAEEYGELKALTVGDVNPLKVDRIAYNLARGIGGFIDDKEDYLLLSGTPILNALAVHLWLRKFPKCKILQWNAPKGEYALRAVRDEHLSNILHSHMMK